MIRTILIASAGLLLCLMLTACNSEEPVTTNGEEIEPRPAPGPTQPEFDASGE